MSEASLVRKQVVLEHLYDEGDKGVMFGVDEVGVDDPWLISLLLPLTDWEDMGRPRQLTLTLYPGDRLNEENQDGEGEAR